MCVFIRITKHEFSAKYCFSYLSTAWRSSEMNKRCPFIQNINRLLTSWPFSLIHCCPDGAFNRNVSIRNWLQIIGPCCCAKSLVLYQSNCKWEKMKYMWILFSVLCKLASLTAYIVKASWPSLRRVQHICIISGALSNCCTIDKITCHLGGRRVFVYDL